jgi:hypothetical protein
MICVGPFLVAVLREVERVELIRHAGQPVHADGVGELVPGDVWETDRRVYVGDDRVDQLIPGDV